jgi:hypothetical protein
MPIDDEFAPHPPSGGGSDLDPTSDNFTRGLSLGDHHTQYPNAITSNQYPGAALSNAVAIKKIRDQDHAYSDYSGTTYQFSIATEEFNDTTANTTQYPHQLLPPVPNSTINKVYCVVVMGPKDDYIAGLQFSMSLHVMVPASAIQYNASWNYTGLTSVGGLYYVWYDSPRFTTVQGLVEYRWDVSWYLNWSPSAIRGEYVLVSLNSFQPIGDGAAQLMRVDYLGLSYNWTYGIRPRFTSPSTDFGGAFSLSTVGLMTVGGLMGLIITPAGVVWIAKHRDTNRFALFVSAITIMTFFLAIFLAGGT